MVWKKRSGHDDEPKPEINRWQNIRRVKDIGRPYYGLLSQYLVIMVILRAVNLAAPFITSKMIFDKVFPQHNVNLLFVAMGASFLISEFNQVMGYIQSYIMRFVSSHIIMDMRRKLFRHLQHLSMSYYDERRTGKILTRLMSDVQSVQALITGSAISVISDFLGFFATATIMLCYFPWYLTALALVMLPFHTLTYIIFSSKVQESAKKVRDKSATIFGSASEVLSGTKVVKSFTAEMRENQAFVGELRELFHLSFWQSGLQTWWSIIASFFQNIGRILIFIVAGMAVIKWNSISMGDFIVYTGYASALFQPVLDFIGLTNQFIPAMVGVSRVYEVLETEPEIKDDPNAVALEQMKGAVEFKDVCFKYKTGDEVLHHIAFQASPGEVVAIVGPSGSGKSTLANLLARFYDVTKGEILIDGVDTRKIKLRSLREQMGAVLQETFLFSGTIEENIKYGKPEATEEEVIEAAREANAYEFIMQQPKGFYSEIGEKGVKLSGGQRQRIAIARAILRDPKVLVLDEATSSLDTASELLIQEALERLMQNRTTFVIAHRLTTIRNANKIVVMNKGNIEQIGSHEELMAVDGLYRTLYEPQIIHEEEITILEPAEQIA